MNNLDMIFAMLVTANHIGSTNLDITVMNSSSNTEKIFSDYVDSALAQHGFSLIAPQLAERRSPGMRQGVLFTAEEMVGRDWVSVRTYSVFDHELDDGPTPEKLTTYDVVAGVCSGGTMAEEDTFLSVLEMTMGIFLPDFLRYGTVDAIVRDVELYPGSASRHIGTRPVAATFNLAHCLETIGRRSEAKALYVEAAEQLEESDDALALVYAELARLRAETLERADTTEGALAKSDDATHDAFDESVLPEMDEALRPFYTRLLRYLESVRQNPAASCPSLLFRAMDELYETDARPGFWRSVSSSAVMNVVKTYAPDFEREMTALSPDELTEYVEDLELGLYMRSFDELCAERLLALPPHIRPETREDVYEWLMADFDRRGEEDESEYLERDGFKGADGAIRAMRILSRTVTP
ncbi:hypothetical protein [Paraburkholderia sp. BL6669N2]|uniref:hypothetical protein n=1 Tax=Paraburkholderia sp. BL6669N2 TaxID=1938807 RepID=UPI0011C07E05|nr:hypothetical protein [Paraburkholderia sp. BL6669N2]